MDKRKEANMRVKRNITEAMLELMQKKSFSDITITEIIRTARVARVSFYRNYRSKEDILTTLIEDVLDLYLFGYGSILLEKLNQSHEILAGTMPNHSIEKYRLYMYIGALYNTAVIWISNGAKENTEDIARIFCETCNIPYK